MREPRCDCCDYPTSMCTRSTDLIRYPPPREHDDPSSDYRYATPRTRTALYRGRCTGCNHWILPGDEITSGPFGWVGECCTPDLLPQEPDQ